MSYIDQLLKTNNIYSSLSVEDDALFARAMNENRELVRDMFPGLQSVFSKNSGPIPVDWLKAEAAKLNEQGLKEEVKQGQHFSSSGTQGKQASLFYDEQSFQRIVAAQTSMFQHHGLIQPTPSNFLLLSPDPREGGLPGYASTFDFMTQSAPIKNKIFAVDRNQNIDLESMNSILGSWSKQDVPIYIFGLTVYLERLILSITRKLKFKGPVRVLSGGGWKSLTRELNYPEIAARVHEYFQAPTVRLYNMYGMNEHALHYLDCEYGVFHAPKFSRFDIVDADMLSVKPGKEGLIRLKNPFMTSFPAFDLLTNDLGVQETDCRCGCKLTGIRLLGRLQQEGTCAYHANNAMSDS